MVIGGIGGLIVAALQAIASIVILACGAIVLLWYVATCWHHGEKAFGWNY